MLYRLGITYNILDENMEHDDIWVDTDIFIESDHPPTYQEAIKICEDNSDEDFHLHVLNTIDENTFPYLNHYTSSSRPLNFHITPYGDEHVYIVRTIYCELIQNVYKIVT